MRPLQIHLIPIAAFSSLLAACGAGGEPNSTPPLVERNSAALLTVSNPEAGEDLFFQAFTGVASNGRACETCHVSGAAFQLTPAHVEARWRKLQQQRRHDPNADDALFRSIDADDHAYNFDLLRQHALVRVVIDLPTDADGNKLVWPVDDPDATSVEVFRAVPSIANVALTMPYQYDGRFATLEEQARAALQGHAEITCAPDRAALEDIAAFERTQFSSPRVAALAQALELGELPEDSSASLTRLQRQGEGLFAKHCGVCHGGPRTNQPIPAVADRPGSLDIFLSKPVPAFAADLPFAASPVADHVRLWAVRVPAQVEPIMRESTDPGRVLQTGNLDNFNEFDTPSLLGISATAPYFRDNSASNLREVVFHYQQLVTAIRRTIPPDAPPPGGPPPIEDEDFDPLIAYLETL